jgi:hypothetical protein
VLGWCGLVAGSSSRSSLTQPEELTRGREDGILRELTIAASAMSDSQSRPPPPPLLGGANGVALASADWADAIAGIFAKKAIGRIPRHLRKLRPGSRQQLKDIPVVLLQLLDYIWYIELKSYILKI